MFERKKNYFQVTLKKNKTVMANVVATGVVPGGPAQN